MESSVALSRHSLIVSTREDARSGTDILMTWTTSGSVNVLLMDKSSLWKRGARGSTGVEGLEVGALEEHAPLAGWAAEGCGIFVERFCGKEALGHGCVSRRRCASFGGGR